MAARSIKGCAVCGRAIWAAIAPPTRLVKKWRRSMAALYAKQRPEGSRLSHLRAKRLHFGAAGSAYTRFRSALWALVFLWLPCAGGPWLCDDYPCSYDNRRIFKVPIL